MLENLKQIGLELSALFFVILIFYLSPEGINGYRFISLTIIAITLLTISILFYLLKNQKPERIQKIYANLVFVSVIICMFAAFVFFIVPPLFGFVSILLAILVVIILLIGVISKETPKNGVFQKHLRKKLNSFGALN